LPDHDGSARYARVEADLFDLDHVTLVSDQRSVGELLFDTDRQARELLMDVSDEDAASLLCAWPLLASAATHLWRALPRSLGPTADESTPVERVERISVNLSRRLTTSSWPPATVPDARMAEMAHALDRAAWLVERFSDQHQLTGSARTDLHAARARIMHTLYVSAHAVTVSLVAYGRARRDQAAGTRRPLAAPAGQTPYAVAPVTEWVRRLAAVEAAAAGFAGHGRLPALLHGEHMMPPADITRMTRALARWDLEAHRGLADSGWRDNMVLIARTQALVCGTAMVLVDAADTSRRDSDLRLRRALSRAGAAWSDLGSRWDDLTTLNVRPSPELLLAASEVRAATRELTHDPASLAPPDVIAHRPGFREGLQAVLQALEHADQLAVAAAEKAGTPDLTGLARALSIRAHDDIEAGRASSTRGEDTVWISPTDILAKNVVPVPPPVCEALLAASQAVLRSATIAGAAAAAAADARPAGKDEDPSPLRRTRDLATPETCAAPDRRPLPHAR
jgi:hypothetical protein